MENVTRTVYGGYVQDVMLLRLPYQVFPNTTLNQKFDIHPDIVIPPNEYPRLSLITIGNGAHRFVPGANNFPLIKQVPHKPRDAALYNHIPFLIRPLEEDLSAIDRANYRLRKIFENNGDTYVAYYGRILSLDSVNASLQLRRVVNGQTTVLPFEPSLDDLSPVPPVLDSNGSFITTGDYVASSAKTNFVLNEQDIAEIISACNFLYGDDGYATISELAACTAIDRPVTGVFSSGTASYTEAVATQIHTHINTIIHLPSVTDHVGFSFEVGNVEPLLQFQPNP